MSTAGGVVEYANERTGTLARREGATARHKRA